LYVGYKTVTSLFFILKSVADDESLVFKIFTLEWKENQDIARSSKKKKKKLWDYI
jgi:hypothetical protein